MLFEREMFGVVCIAGQFYIRALLMTPPDNKLVEDVHAYLRDLSRKGRGNMSSAMARTAAAIHSKRIEAREIPHLTVSHDYFIDNFLEMRNATVGSLFNSRRYKLPEAFPEVPWDLSL